MQFIFWYQFHLLYSEFIRMEASSLGQCWIGLSYNTTNSKFKGIVLLKSIAPVGGDILYAKILFFTEFSLIWIHSKTYTMYKV